MKSAAVTLAILAVIASAVLAQLPMQEGIGGAQLFPTTVLSTILFTIIFSTILVFATEKGYYAGTSALEAKLLSLLPRARKNEAKKNV